MANIFEISKSKSNYALLSLPHPVYWIILWISAITLPKFTLILADHRRNIPQWRDCGRGLTWELTQPRVTHTGDDGKLDEI